MLKFLTFLTLLTALALSFLGYVTTAGAAWWFSGFALLVAVTLWAAALDRET